MDTSSWIFTMFTLAISITCSSGLECYRCSRMVITSNLTYPDDEVIRQIAHGLSDSKCRRTDSNYVQTQNQQDINNWNTGSQTGTLYPNTCPTTPPGSSKVVKCGVWEGTVHATVFTTKRLILTTFAFGCAEVEDYLTYGCHSRNGDMIDREYFRQVLYGSFRENVLVDNFQGTFCLCQDSACQLVSDANQMGGVSFAIALVLAILSTIASKRF